MTTALINTDILDHIKSHTFQQNLNTFIHTCERGNEAEIKAERYDLLVSLAQADSLSRQKLALYGPILDNVCNAKKKKVVKLTQLQGQLSLF